MKTYCSTCTNQECPNYKRLISFSWDCKLKMDYEIKNKLLREKSELIAEED